MNHLVVPPVRRLIEILVADDAVLILDTLVPRNVFFVAGFPCEPLLAEGAGPGGFGVLVVSCYVYGQAVGRFKHFVANITFYGWCGGEIRFAKEIVRFKVGLAIELLATEMTFVKFQVDHFLVKIFRFVIQVVLEMFK